MVLHGVGMSTPLRLITQDALIHRLTLNVDEGKRTVFLVGSPLTAPHEDGAPGVPGVGAMVERARAKLPKGNDHQDSTDYQEVFTVLQDYAGPDRVNQLIREAVLEACVHPDDSVRQEAAAGQETACREMEQDPSHWALTPGAEALGRLLTRLPDAFGQRVLTSNFDPLISMAVRGAGGTSWETKLHGEGNLDQSSARGCQVIHVHGYWYGTDTLHNPAQLQQPRPQLTASLKRLFEDSTLVAVAYGGWNDVFTRSLFELVRDGGAFPEILWTFYSNDPDRIQRDFAPLLDGLRPGMNRGRVSLVGGIDCHAFFPELVAALTTASKATPVHVSGPPRTTPQPSSPFIVGVPIERDEDFYGRHKQQELLRDAMLQCQPVQILGERRMGKTSLLRWLQGHVSDYRRDWPVAWINAQGPEGRSPGGFVQAVGWALGKRPEVDKRLDRSSAETVLRELLPVVLLVDEADALTERGHGFDDGFLDTLRAWGQDGQLLWISASLRDLHPQFRATGLTSRLLNDSRTTYVGQLEEDEARRLVLDGGLDDEVETMLNECGGFAYALQGLGDALWRGRMLEAAVDDLETALQPTFDGWWVHRSEPEKEVLKSAHGGLQLAKISRRERRLARALTRLGLLSEQGDAFELPGAMWRRYVAER